MKSRLEGPMPSRTRGRVWQVRLSATGRSIKADPFAGEGCQAIAYEADGDLSDDWLWAQTRMLENRLTRVITVAGPSSSFRRVEWKYDAMGRRVRQTSYVLSNGVWQVVEDLKLVSDPVLFGRHVAELNATNNALVRAYIWGLDLSETVDGAGGVGDLLWVRVAGGPAAGTHFVCYDGNGNVWNLVSASTGSETARYEYGPFGEPLRLSGPAGRTNPFRFSTKRTEDFSGLVLYEYRAYSPTSGRWLSRDPLGDQAFFLLCAAGRSRRERAELREARLMPNYAFAANDGVSHTDGVGLKMDAAWCQRWYTDCLRDALRGYKDCAGCMGPSAGRGLASCLFACMKWAAGGWISYGICFTICTGVDSGVFLMRHARCMNALHQALRGCTEGYDRCLSRTSE